MRIWDTMEALENVFMVGSQSIVHKSNIYKKIHPLFPEYMEDEMKCKLPWTSDKNKDMQVCSTNEHLMNFSTHSQSMMYFGESKYYQITKCLQPCKYYYFTAKQVRFLVHTYN